MRLNGKGDKRRPQFVCDAEMEGNWLHAFRGERRENKAERRKKGRMEGRRNRHHEDG